MGRAPTFAHVVQQGAQDQQVGTADIEHVVGGVGHRLQEVTVDAPAVVGVELREVAHVRPLRHVPLPTSPGGRGLMHRELGRVPGARAALGHGFLA